MYLDYMETTGIGFAFAVMCFGVIKWQSKRNQNLIERILTKELDRLEKKIDQVNKKTGQTVMKSDETIELFKWCMSDHIDQKVKYAREILEINKINERKEMIKKNLLTKFKSITQDEAGRLSRYNTPAGDIGKILNDSVDWKKFMEEIYDIFFREDMDVNMKCSYMRSIMRSYVNDLIGIIEKKMRENSPG